MRILHVNWSLNRGGTESLLVDIMNEQVKDHEIWWICINDSIDEILLKYIDSRVHIVKLLRKGGRNPWPIIKLNWYLHKISPDIIHLHQDNIAQLFFCNKKPIVRTLHSTLGNAKDSHLAARLCFISEAVRQYSLFQGFDGDVVYNGIHVEKILCKEKRESKNSIIRIVQVGRLEHIKGQHLLVEAANVLKQRNINNFSIDFIGDGSAFETLQKLISKYELNGCVHLLGAQDRDYVYEHLCDYDLYVQASISEGFGLTIAEGMAAGLPIITSNLEGPMEVIGNGEYGDCFEANNYTSLADKIVEFIEGKILDKTEKAREFLNENFTIQSTVKKYAKIYRKVSSNERF